MSHWVGEGCSEELADMPLCLGEQGLNFCYIEPEKFGGCLLSRQNLSSLTSRSEVGYRNKYLNVYFLCFVGPRTTFWETFSSANHSPSSTHSVFPDRGQHSLSVLLKSCCKPAFLHFLSAHFHTHFACSPKQVFMVFVCATVWTFWLISFNLIIILLGLQYCYSQMVKRTCSPRRKCRRK